MYIVISYDIVDDKKRSRVAVEVRIYGCRDQKNVFECLLDERRLKETKTWPIRDSESLNNADLGVWEAQKSSWKRNDHSFKSIRSVKP